METHTPTPSDRLHLFAARLKLWLLDVCLWLSEWLGRRVPRAARIMLRQDLREALFGARVVVFLLAISRCGAPKPVHVERPHAAPPGFRRAGALDNDLRNVKRTVRLRGRTLAARLAEVRAVLDNLDAWAARAVKRLLAGAHGARLLLCVAVADRLLTLPVFAPTFVDSS